MDALASGGDEGRGKLRKALGNCKQVLIRGYPNGATRLAEGQSPAMLEQTGGTETSQYPQEKKEIIDSLSSGDRTGKSLNRCCYGNIGVVGSVISILIMNWNVLENSTIDGDSPVQVS